MPEVYCMRRRGCSFLKICTARRTSKPPHFAKYTNSFLIASYLSSIKHADRWPKFAIMPRQAAREAAGRRKSPELHYTAIPARRRNLRKRRSHTGTVDSSARLGRCEMAVLVGGIGLIGIYRRRRQLPMAAALCFPVPRR